MNLKKILKLIPFRIKILDLYIIKKFLGTFFYSLALLITIVVVFDISENVQEFIDNKASFYSIIFEYYINFIPYFVNLFSALFTFISVIFFTSKLAYNNEIIAILGSGITYRRLLLPYILSALVLAMISFGLSNFLIPYTNKNMNKFKDKYIGKQIKSKDEDIHIKLAQNSYAYVERWDNFNKVGYNFTLENMNYDGIYYKISSQNIQWDSIKNTWRLNNYLKHFKLGMKEKIMSGNLLDTTLNISPKDFVIIKDHIETMNYRQIRKFIDDEKSKGSDKVKFYEVEKHKRIAFPFATIVLSIIGLTVAGRKIRGGLGIHLVIGLTLSFSFIMFMQITTVFATSGNLPPILAVWIPNLIFGLLSIFLLKYAQK